MRFLGRGDRDDLNLIGRLLADIQALPLHFRRQDLHDQLGPVLHVDRVDVGIGAGCKSDEQAVAAVGAGSRLEVERIVDAAHLLLDGLGDGLGHHVGIGAVVYRVQRDLRRDDVG